MSQVALDDEALALLLRHLHADAVSVEGIWARAQMALLDPAQRSGWKLHLSATPSGYRKILALAVPVLVAARVPFKVLRGLEEVERMNAGEYGLMQVGKCITVYPQSEAHAFDLASALGGALSGVDRGPAVPTDMPFGDDAPIYFRYGPYDGRTIVDAMGQERRLLWREDLGRDTWDASTGGALEGPETTLLPRAGLADHLAFLRDDYTFLSMLQLSAKGVVFIGASRSAPAKVLIKTARAGTNSDRLGRDAVWALKREHALLQALAGIPGVPAAGTLIASSGVAAIVRPYLEGETFWALWTQAGARRPQERARLAKAIDQVADTLTCIHARGHIVRDVSAGNIVLAEDRAYLTDLELAHAMDDIAPPYRRGTRGFYDPEQPPGTAPTPKADTYALEVLSAMIAEDPVPSCTYAIAASHPPITAPKVEDYFRHAFAASIGHEAKPEAANVYGGVAGLLLAAQTCGVEIGAVADLQRVAHQIVCAIPALRHIPGYYFGASGLAVALGLLASRAAAPEDAGLRVLGAMDLAQCAIPDVCQGVAGHLLAALTIHTQTGDASALVLASAAGERLCDLARVDGVSQLWPWPDGAFGDLSGAICFGFAHGVAGVTYALLRLQAIAPTARIAATITGGLHALNVAARAVPGEDDAVWWPVSAHDATCWNAWCHGTPGVIKTLALARRMQWPGVSQGLLERALRGMGLANNSELCLCHGVASRVQAWSDVFDLGLLPDGSAACALAHDRALLSRALGAADGMSAFADAHASDATGYGLMTGATGALLALRRGEITPIGHDEFCLF